MSAFKDITGRRFGKLVALERIAELGGPKRYKKAYWRCRCDCGRVTDLVSGSLTSGRTKSCGCLRVEVFSKPPGESGFNRLYATYRSAAKTGGREFALTKTDVLNLTSQVCHYCGIEPQQKAFLKKCKSKETIKNSTYIYNGIDRKDSTKGYTLDNVVTACYKCNRAKMDMTLDEFFEWADRIATRLRGPNV